MVGGATPQSLTRSCLGREGMTMAVGFLLVARRLARVVARRLARGRVHEGNHCKFES